MYEIIPKEIMAAVDKARIDSIRSVCEELDDRAAKQLPFYLALAAAAVFLLSLLCIMRPDALPAALSWLARAGWALSGLTGGLSVAAAACFYAWRQRERMLLSQVSVLITRMERQCPVRVVLRWWSKARSVADIPATYKDLAVRILETKQLNVSDARLYVKVLDGASRIVGAYRRDYMFAKVLGLPLPGQAAMPSPEMVDAQGADTAPAIVEAAPAPSPAPSPEPEAPLAATAEELVAPETAPVAAPVALKPLAEVVHIHSRASRVEKATELTPSNFHVATTSARELPSAAMDIKAPESVLGWADSHLIRLSVYSGLPHAWATDDQVRAAFQVMRKASWHTFLVMTPHPKKLAEVTHDLIGGTSHVWLGVNITQQEDVAQRVPALCAIKAAVRFVHVSARDPIALEPFAGCTSCKGAHDPECAACKGTGYLLNWVITGGASGPSAAPTHASVYRNLRAQAAKFGHFSFTGWGDWVHEEELRAAGEGVFLEAVESSMNKKLESARCKGGGYAFRLGAQRPTKTLDGVLHVAAPLTRARRADSVFSAFA